MRGSGRPPLVMASSSRPVTGGTLSDRPHRPAARGHGDSTASSGRRRGAGRGSRQGAGVMRRLGGVEPGLTLCPQPSRVRSLAGAASGPGSGWRRPVSSSCAPPRSASSQRPVSSARAAADTRKVWAAGLTGCVGAHQPAVRGGSSATQPAASPEPACWPAFRRPRCCWRQQPTAISARPLRRTQARRGAAPRGSRARTGRWANACERAAAPRHPPAAPQPLRRAKPNALKMPQGRHFAPKRR